MKTKLILKIVGDNSSNTIQKEHNIGCFSLPYQMNTVSPTMPAMGIPSVSSFSLPPKQIVEDDDYDAWDSGKLKD